jgi:threonine dehydrogenase-like Zn-dependent dehydrogenase
LNRDGAFADFVALPQKNLHLVPDNVPDEQAVFTEPVAAAFQIPAQVPLRSGMEVVVLGDGRLGNLCAQVLRNAGCRVLVVGKHRRKLDVLSKLGLTTAELADFSQRRCADLVVDCSGSPSGLPMALQVVRPRGTVVLKTTVAGEQTLALAPIVIDEVTIVGSRCGPFDRALGALAEGAIDVRPLCDGVLPIEDTVQALEEARTSPVLKLLLAVDTSFGRDLNVPTRQH